MTEDQETFVRQTISRLTIRALYTIASDGKSITCHRCGKTSYNRNDVAERYCGQCHAFHDDVDEVR